MPIPDIDAYPMPENGDFPEPVPGWTPDPKRALLLVHDMQRYFLRPFDPDRAPGRELIRHTSLLRDSCADLGVPVAYTAQPGGMTEQQRGLLKDFWGPGMQVLAEDREVIDELKPAGDDWVFTKWRYSAFFHSDLLAKMREHGRDQIIVCGVYAHVGVLMTAVEAFTNDIETFVVADAVADFSESRHRMALDYAAERCAVVKTTKTVLSDLKSKG